MSLLVPNLDQPSSNVIDVDTFRVEIDLTQDPQIIDLSQDSDDDPGSLASGKTATTSASVITSHHGPNAEFRLALSTHAQQSRAHRSSASSSSQPASGTSEQAMAAHTGAVPSSFLNVMAQGLPAPPSHINREIGRTAQKHSLKTYHEDGPSVKRQRLSEEKEMKPSFAGTLLHGHKRSVDVAYPIIELSSGDEASPESKRLKFSNKNDEDSDEDYATLHAGFNLENHMRWPLPKYPKPVNREQELSSSMQQLQIAKHSKKRNTNAGVQSRRPKTVEQVEREAEHVYLWDQLRMAADFTPIVTTRTQEQSRLLRRRAMPHHRRDLFDLEGLKLTTSFKDASGTINRIVQKREWTAVCSTVMGGGADSPDEVLNRYNSDGNLMLWRDSLQLLREHSRPLNGSTKYYTVNDIKFDPRSHCLLSSANDRAVRVWVYDETEDTYFHSHKLGSCNAAAYDIEIQPESGTIAVASRRVHIYSALSADDLTSHAIEIAGPPSRTQLVGGISWGRGGTSHLLFASSEPLDTSLTGHHKVIDVQHHEILLTLDATEAGDAIATDPKGETLALFTRGEENKHLFRLYDIRRTQARSVLLANLQPSRQGVDAACRGDVNRVSFSPDGLYIALARDDNCTHLYDMRMVGKGVLAEYGHWKPAVGYPGAGLPKVNPGLESYGAVDALWVEGPSRRLGLVTGGDDGCVRLWDPLIAEDSKHNGRVLAETHSDIGHFCIGDRCEGEHDLVVGDASGTVYIFNKFRA